MGVQTYAEDRCWVVKGHELWKLLSFLFSASKTPLSMLYWDYVILRLGLGKLHFFIASWLPVTLFQLGELEEDWKARGRRRVRLPYGITSSSCHSLSGNGFAPWQGLLISLTLQECAALLKKSGEDTSQSLNGKSVQAIFEHLYFPDLVPVI